ncbi:MAG TPA: DUF502 domain-containing protein [bacterium]|nr:DUF502 domain-containing protein [bacterium]HEX67978.1 DUF502 domain-containing protein [bacterium]
MKRVRDNFVAGILVLLPLAVTLWFLYWVVTHLLQFSLVILPPQLERYFREYRWAYALWTLFVVLVAFLGISFVGAFTRNFIGKRLLRLVELPFTRIPLLSRIYTLVQKISLAILGRERHAFLKVVLVEFPRKGSYTVGFVTSRWEKALPEGSSMVSVFVPTAPNPTSGFLIILPEEDTIPLSVSVQEAFSFVISGGMATFPLRLEEKFLKKNEDNR